VRRAHLRRIRDMPSANRFEAHAFDAFMEAIVESKTIGRVVRQRPRDNRSTPNFH
jgi:hypothetical protein